MVTPSWQLQTPISAIIFDCDGTLTSIEGIDELAKNNGVGESVQILTANAMGTTGINPELYQKRLDLVRPTHEQVIALGREYFSRRSPNSSEVIKLLQKLKKEVYLISAGLLPAVQIFGELLHIPKANIFAVDIQFDHQGSYLSYESNSPMVRNDGKRQVIAKIKATHPDLAFIGDGLNDLSARDLVKRFIGYGGAYYRENIAAQCDYYIATLSLAPLLSLVLTAEEENTLVAEDQKLLAAGLEAIRGKKVKV